MPVSMTFRSHEELVCWQLSAELRDGVNAVLDAIPWPKDLEFCRDLSASTRSAAANIAEGFGRSTRTFRHRLDIAMGSLRESGTHLDEALARKYMTREQHQHFRRLAKRAHKAACGLVEYLDSLAPTEPLRSRRPKPGKPGKPG